MAKPGTSEFERRGPKPFGGHGTANAHEKLAIIKRTEQDPEEPLDLNAPADKFEHGGVPEYTRPDPNWHRYQEDPDR